MAPIALDRGRPSDGRSEPQESLESNQNSTTIQNLPREMLRNSFTAENQPLGNGFIATTQDVSVPVFWDPDAEPIAVSQRTRTLIRNLDSSETISIESEQGTGFVSLRLRILGLNIQVEVKDEVHEISPLRN